MKWRRIDGEKEYEEEKIRTSSRGIKIVTRRIGIISLGLEEEI